MYYGAKFQHQRIMRNTYQIVKWLSLIVFVLAFLDYKHLLELAFIQTNYHIGLMVGAAIAMLVVGRSWLGAILFLIGLSLELGWISFHIEGVSFSGAWFMLGGFITMFLNSRY